MQNRVFGRNAILISEVGLGCWQLGSDWGELDDASAMGILQAAVEQGITFFDTADVYGGGRSETLIGKFLKTVDSAPFVATKAGRNGIYPDGYTKDSLRTCIEASLKRLDVDRLDLLQMHCIPFEVMQEGEVWSWLDDFQEAGLIQEYGASVETMQEANWCIDNVPNLYSLQIIFNLLRQKPVETLFDKALEQKTGIIARVPLASGLLTGKFTTETKFGASDHRNYNADGTAFNVGETFGGIPFGKGLEIVEKLGAFKPDDLPMAQWALRWILDHPAVSVVIPGASNPRQVASNAAVSELPPLSMDQHTELSQLYASEIAAHIRGPY
jgi:aryl-alcohol dehydrogenase-like predicted oxidoreductase